MPKERNERLLTAFQHANLLICAKYGARRSRLTCATADTLNRVLQPRIAESNQPLFDSALLGCALHKHKLHLSQMYRLLRDEAGRIFLKNDGLVLNKCEQFPIELHASLLPLY